MFLFSFSFLSKKLFLVKQNKTKQKTKKKEK